MLSPLWTERCERPEDHLHDHTKSIISIADELNKLVKLKKQGAITEEEFSQMKRNLMEGMKDH
jgi:hypothetical protein